MKKEGSKHWCCRGCILSGSDISSLTGGEN